jgi:metal-responsive CopG/Arc/MetJ family transcriptional regulator
MLKNAKAVMIYPSFALLERIEKYWHDQALQNRSVAIIELIEKGIAAAEKKKKGNIPKDQAF